MASPSRLSLMLDGVRRARAIMVIAGLMSKPKDFKPREAPTVVVVPDPFQGSRIFEALGKCRERTLFANELVNPA